MLKKITQQELKELLHYNPKTGIFRWKKKVSTKINIWQIAGNLDRHGYLKIQIDKKEYRAHRLAWLYETGRFPKEQIDHKNHKRTDNRIVNLREATHQENGKNLSMYSSNMSGATGVCWDKRRKKWRSFIRDNGKQIHIGYFKNKKDAIKARKKAEIFYGYHENHGKGK